MQAHPQREAGKRDPHGGKRGRNTGCGYVDVKKVIVERSWWGSLFKR